jgi:choline dehydrogenase-like flavoprotein
MSEMNSTDLPAGTVLETDLCIIGAGAAGLTMAREFIGAQRRVLLLESGIANQPRSDSPATTGRLPPARRRYHDPVVQPLYHGETAGALAAIDPTFPSRSRSRCAGGSTNCWEGWLRPLDPVDFDGRPGWPTGWPFAYRELLPHYRRALELCGIEREAWSHFQEHRPIWDPPAPSGDGGVRPVRLLVMDPRGELSFDRRHGEELRRASNVVLLRNANALSLRIDRGEVQEVEVRAIDPATHSAERTLRVVAPLFVLATGGIENVRLLRAADLPEASPWLGAGFMCHPLYVNALAFRPGPAGLPPGLAGFFEPSAPAGGYLLRGALASCPHDDPGDGQGAFRSLVFTAPDEQGRCSASIDWEQRPDPSNRVELTERRDPVLGLPSARVTWGLGSADRWTVSAGLRRLTHYLRAAADARDVSSIEVEDRWPERDLAGEPLHTGEHHLGATRMALRPDDGVVSPECRVFGSTNLFVAGGSIFPRAGHANPTLTILALSLRLADHLKRVLARADRRRRCHGEVALDAGA